MRALKSSKLAIMDLIKTSGEITLNEITRLIHLGKTTVRQHLQDLESLGLLTSAFRKSARGRPELIYKLTVASQNSFPSQDGKVLQDLIVYAESIGNQNLIQDFFRKFWNLRKKEFQKRIHERSATDLKTRIQVLKAMLTEEGFMPKVESTAKKQLAIHECNCPFSETVKVTKIPCQLESDFIRFALQVPVKRVKYIPAGDPTCSYRPS